MGGSVVSGDSLRPAGSDIFGCWMCVGPWRTCRQLEILKTLPAPLMEPFPEPDTMESEEYQEMIQILREGQKQLESGMGPAL